MRSYFPELKPWVAQSASLPAVHPVYLCANVGPGGATHCSACPAHHHSESGPLGLSVWMNVYFVFPWCWTPLLFDFLSVLVVRGGAVCLPTPPSWFSPFNFLLYFTDYAIIAGTAFSHVAHLHSASPSQVIPISLSVSMGHAYRFFGYSLHLLSSSPLPTPMTAVSLFHASVLPLLFCTLVYFVH